MTDVARYRSECGTPALACDQFLLRHIQGNPDAFIVARCPRHRLSDHALRELASGHPIRFETMALESVLAALVMSS